MSQDSHPQGGGRRGQPGTCFLHAQHHCTAMKPSSQQLLLLLHLAHLATWASLPTLPHGHPCTLDAHQTTEAACRHTSLTSSYWACFCSVCSRPHAMIQPLRATHQTQHPGGCSTRPVSPGGQQRRSCSSVDFLPRIPAVALASPAV